MPNWKKVIVSGSDAVLNNITATGNVTVQGDIIAENYIVSSSVTYMTQSFSSGSTIFGNDGTDTHQFTGSLYLSQSSINLDYGGRIFGASPGDVNIWPATANNYVSIKGQLVAQNITSSNNILVGNIIQGPPSPTNPLWSINAGGLGTFDSLTVNGTVNLNGTINNYGNGANDRHTFTGNITASNDISASGDIYGNSYVVQNAGVIALSSPYINFGNNSYRSQYKGTSHYFPAAITASIISASSDLYAGLDENNNTSYKTVVYNTTTGQLFYTGSYENAGINNLGVGYIISGTDGLDIINPGGPTASIYLDLGEVIEGWNASGEYTNGIVTNYSPNGNFQGVVETQLTFSETAGLNVDNNITASGDISASGHLFASTSNAAGNYNSVLVVDTASGQFYYTGSYGSGGSETTLPGGDGTYVQYSGSSGFNGDSGLTYGANTNTLRIGTTVPQTIAAGYTFQSGSHFAVDGKALITNAEVVKWTPEFPQSENYILVGLGVGTAIDPATGNTYLTRNPGDGLAQADGNNASPLLGGLDQQGELENLSGARVNGALKIGGVYANYRTNTGWLVYANGFVSVPGSPGIAIRNGGIEIFSSESYAGDPERSGSIASPRASASAVFTLANDSSSLLLQVGKEDLRDVMFISRSGDNPRIGIGTNNPLTNFDFKDVSDSSTGTKMILRSSRPTKGGDNGDEAGRINFVIDSSSYGDIETSGSIAKILGSASSIGTEGAAGKLSFEVSDVFTSNLKNDTTEVFRLQKNPSGFLDLTYTVGVFEGSVNLNGANSSLYAGKDVEAVGNLFTTNGYIQSTNGYVRANNLRIGTNSNPGSGGATIAGNITASNNISASGDIIANNGSFSGDLTVDGNITANQYIVSSSVTYMTQSFSSGSTIFGDTLDDTHLFTGSVNITGSLTVDGMTYPTTDGNDGQVLLTDGSGALTFGDVKVYAQVKNISGVTLAKGTPVHATASASPPAGNVSEVIAASASLASSMPATFILDEELANEAEGRAILSGFINGVDTSAFKEGDVVYVGENGGYTTTKPTGTNLIQNLGIVTKVDASNGAGYIYGSGRSNDVPNIAEGYAWVGNSSGVATATATSSFVVTTSTTASYVAAGNIDGTIDISDQTNLTGGTNLTLSGDTMNLDANISLTSVTTSGNISSSGAIIGNTLTGSLNIPNNGTLGIGQQTFYPHGANGFSVNENFDASNSSTQTAYHYTSGDAARSSVVFSIARTSNFTNMFGVTGSAADNKFVIGAEFANTDFEWRKSLGISPVQLQGGTLLARLDRSGSFYVSNDITASGNISASGDVIGATGSFDVIFGGTF